MKKLKLLSYFYSLLLLIALSAIPSRAVEVTVGTGTESSIYPFRTNYEDAKTQFLVTTADLAGNPVGHISTIAFDVTTVVNYELNGFTIKVQNSSLTSLSGFVADGFTTVYNGNYTVTATGWNEFTFSTPFLWDGTSNLLFELCFDNDDYSWDGDCQVNATAVTGMTWVRANDSPEDMPSGCDFDGGGTSETRPNVKLNMIPASVPYITASPATINFNYVPAEGVSDSQTILIGGDNLSPASGAFSLVPSEGFEVSTDNGTTWTTEATLNYVGNPIATLIPVMVRFTPYEEQNYAGTITIEGGGTTYTVNLLGTSILNYCTPVSTTTYGWDIANVTIGNINYTSQPITPISGNSESNRVYTDLRDSVPAINAQAGSTIPYSVNLINSETYGFSGTLKVWIDLNRDAIINPSTELVSSIDIPYASPVTTGLLTGSITIPPNAVVGQNTLIRYMISSSASSTPCSMGSYVTGEAEDYWINFSAPSPYIVSTPKTHNFGVIVPGTQSESKDFTIEAGVLTPASGNLTVTPSANFQISLDSITWSNAPLTLAYSDGGATVTPSKVKVRFNSPTALGLGFAGTVTINGANAQAPGVINLIANNMQTYSPSSVSMASTTDTIDIAKVTIGSYSFGEANVTPITGRSTANKKYTDNRLAAPELTLNFGSTYQYTVNTYTTGSAMPLCSLRVYADYNADGDFTDNSELISNVAIPAANNGIISGTFMVPTDTNIVKINRLNSPRIRFVLSTYEYNSSTDSTYQVGETEDYKLKITPAIPMVYVSNSVSQVGKQVVSAGSQNEKMLRVKVTMNNAATPLALSRIVFNTNGTNPISALSSARVFFTADTATFNTNTPVAAANEEPNGVLDFEAENINFKAGDNYLWLAYSVNSDAGLDAILDAELTGLYISDAPTVNKITTPQAPEGISLVSHKRFDGSFNATAFENNTANFPFNDWTVPATTYPWYIRNIGRNNASACTPYLGTGMAELYGYWVWDDYRFLYSPSFPVVAANLPDTVNMWVYRTGTTGTTTLTVKLNTSASITGATTLSTADATPVDVIPARISAEPVVATAGWYNYSFVIPESYVPGESNYLILEGFGDYTNNIYVDEVKFTDDEDAYMALGKIDTLRTGNDVFARSTENNLVNAFNVQTIASNNAYEITNIKFTPEGTTNLASISNAKVWYLGGTAVFNPATNKLFGTVATIASGQNTVVRTADSAVIKLAEGNNYFAISYDVPANATAGTIVDCKVNSITLSRDGEATDHIIANGNTWGTHEIKLPLIGTYTVGGTQLASRWYPTLVEAADEASLLGISGNTEFAIASDQVFTATQNPVFATVNNVGGNYTLTVYPKDAPRTITGNIAGGEVGVLTFAGADRVIVDGRVNKQGTERGLTIVNNDEGQNLFFVQTDVFGSTNTATVKYVNFKGKENTNSANTFGLVFLGKEHSNITITNNQFSRISSGILIQGTDTLNKVSTVSISNNIFGNTTESERLRRYGVFVAHTNDINIENNTFKGLGSTSKDMSIGNIIAINLGSGINNANVISNIINDMANYNTSGYGAYGVNIASNIAIFNVNIFSNSISKFLCDGDGLSTTYSPFGIRIAGGSDIKVINNSIDFSGIYTGTGQGMSACFAITSTDADSPRNLTVKNNIFSNGLNNADTSSRSYSIYAPTGTTFATINNNNYYVSGDRGVLSYFGVDKLTLADWQASTTQDGGSVSTKVAFLSDSDMHLSGASACNTALNCPLASEVSSDIDGIDRGEQTKMGVDEVFATFSITGQPVSTVSQCVTLGSSNTIDIPVGTFNVSTYSDGIARPFNAGDLEYSWTKNNEAIAGNSAPLKVLFSDATLPTTNDVYQATVTLLNTAFTSTTLTLVEGPAIFTLTRTGTSPMTIGLSSSESGATYTLLRNSVEVANSSMVGTGSALAFGSFSEAGTYRIKAVKGTCETIMTDSAVIIPAGYTLSGTIKYANTAQTAMNNCIIIIKSGDLEVRRDTTDATGAYSVSGLANGTYSIEVLTTKAHGGINTFDITPIKQKLANVIELSPLKFKAADLNKSNSINTFDITPIKQKLANQVAPGWVASNYVFYPVSVTIASGNSTLDIQSLCSGDVNGSFVPSSGN